MGPSDFAADIPGIPYRERRDRARLKKRLSFIGMTVTRKSGGSLVSVGLEEALLFNRDDRHRHFRAMYDVHRHIAQHCGGQRPPAVGTDDDVVGAGALSLGQNLLPGLALDHCLLY